MNDLVSAAMKENCKVCGNSFEIIDSDLDFYERVSPVLDDQKFKITPPSTCPGCRMQERLLFRNFYTLYRRTSDLSGKPIISMYAEDAPFPVYEMHEWWSDQWDELKYGLEVDFNRPVFAQLDQLHRSVPRMSISNVQTENTDYCNLSFASKDCYLVFGNVRNEGCCYGHIVWDSKDCFDCLYVYRSELCYECVDCVDCYNVSYSVGSENCSDSSFLLNCRGCKNCFGCVGIFSKEYHLFNQPCSRKEYQRKVADFNLQNKAAIAMIKQTVNELHGEEIIKHYHGFSCENVTGDYLYNCRNVFDSYDAKNCEDSRYLGTVETFIDCYDCNYSPARTELSYNCVAVDGYGLIGCHCCNNNCSNLIYCDNCYSSRDCIACAGLRSKQYCIFNKQYSEQEYLSLAARVVQHMQSGGEWGEFFPKTITPFAYNETMAQEYFPLTRDEALKAGYRWKEPDPRDYQAQQYQVPDTIDAVEDEILNHMLACRECGKNFKITRSELQFHRKGSFSLSASCPDCRHKDRMKKRNPRRLWNRFCEDCGKKIQSTYSPKGLEIVYCEECYLRTVY
jgi:hypothetical protein